MILSLIPWMITGMSGFLLFGEKTSANVLDNFPIDDIPAIIARFALSMNVAISVPYYCCAYPPLPYAALRFSSPLMKECVCLSS